MDVSDNGSLSSNVSVHRGISDRFRSKAVIYTIVSIFKNVTHMDNENLKTWAQLFKTSLLTLSLIPQFVNYM